MREIIEDSGEEDSEIEGSGKIRVLEEGDNMKEMPRPRPSAPCRKYI